MRHLALAFGLAASLSLAACGDTTTSRLGQAFRALQRARDRAIQAGAAEGGAALSRLTAA